MPTHTEKSVNINSATVEELSKVPGLGPAIAQRILDGRPYDSLEDLKKVRGIGPLFLEKIRPHLAVTAKEDEVVEEPPVIELIESEPFFEGEKKETDQEADKPEELQTLEEDQINIVETSIEEPEIEHEALESLEEPVEAVEKEAVQVKEEPLVAVGERSQSIFYPAEPEEEEAEEEIPRAIQVMERKAMDEEKPVQKKKTLSRREIIAWVAGGGVVSILLSVLIVLGIFGIINNSLRYMTAQQGARQISALQGQLSDLEDQIGMMEDDISGLRTRLDTLESFGGRISTLEDQSEALTSDLAETKDQMTEAVGQLEEINGQMDTITEEIDKLKEASGLFETFLKGLQSLLNETLPAEAPEGAQP